MARYRTWAEWDGLTGADALTAPERQLAEACRAGQPCVLGDGKRPDGPDPARTIRADFLRYLIIGGCDAWPVDPIGVRLKGAYVRAMLVLDFDFACGQTFLVACRFERAVSALQARFQLLNLSGSAVPSLNAQGAKVTGDVFLRNGFHATGEVNLPGAMIGGQLTCRKGRFENAKGDALNAHSAEITGGVFLDDGFHATNEVCLSGAKIGGQLACSDGRFENAEGFALNAHSAKVTGTVFLNNGFHATGEVSLPGATIGGQLACSKGRFENAKGDALNAHSAEITGNVFLDDGFHATGEVHLSGTKIGGKLECSNGKFENARGSALIAERLRVGGAFFWRKVEVAEGLVSLAATHVGDLNDDPKSWPTKGSLLLDGFTYDRIAASAFTDARKRLRWLANGDGMKEEFFPQPYSQLAKVLREMGHDRAARQVMLEKERRQRAHECATLSRSRDARRDGALRTLVAELLDKRLAPWNWLLDRVVGYGYAPERAAVWLIVLFVIATTLAHLAYTEGSFAPNSDVILTSLEWTELAEDTGVPNPAEAWSAPDGPGRDWETFNRYAYAFDVVVPILTLGQTAAWAPSTTRGPWGWNLWWARWVLSALGWLVTALGAAAITGIIRRE